MYRFFAAVAGVLLVSSVALGGPWCGVPVAVAVPAPAYYYPAQPYVAAYAPPVYAYPAPVYAAPIVPVYRAYRPVVVAPVMVAPAPLIYGGPAVVRARVYPFGQPVRNVVRAILP
jgi:hypothetical protein